MDYMGSFDVLGLKARQRPCLIGNGEPTTSTKGTVGELYMDTDTGLIYKCIGESEGEYAWQAVVKTKKPDYNQNDATQPDYIKNRPFYTARELYTEAEFDSSAEAGCGSFNLPDNGSALKAGETLYIEIETDGVVHKGYADVVFGDYDVFLSTESEKIGDQHFAYIHPEFIVIEDNAPKHHKVKIYKDVVHKIDNKYLDLPPGVNSIYGGSSTTPTNECYNIEDLKDGVYMLSGYFRTSKNLRLDQYSEPTICQVYRNSEDTITIANFAAGRDNNVLFYTLTVSNGDITSYNQLDSDDIVRKSEDVCPIITDDEDTYDERPVNGYAVKAYLSSKVFDVINLVSDAGIPHYVTIDADGNLKATPW